MSGVPPGRAARDPRRQRPAALRLRAERAPAPTVRHRRRVVTTPAASGAPTRRRGRGTTRPCRAGSPTTPPRARDASRSSTRPAATPTTGSAADAASLAAALTERGVGAGAVVSVQLPNRYEAAVAAVAVGSLGAVINPLLPNYRAHELEHVWRTARPAVVFTPDVLPRLRPPRRWSTRWRRRPASRRATSWSVSRHRRMPTAVRRAARRCAGRALGSPARPTRSRS